MTRNSGRVPRWRLAHPVRLHRLNRGFGRSPRSGSTYSGPWRRRVAVDRARVSININTRSAVEAIYAPQSDRDGFSVLDYGIVRVKRTLVHTDWGGVFGTLGGAFARRRYSARPVGAVSADLPVEYSINAAIGIGAERELGAHAAPFARRPNTSSAPTPACDSAEVSPFRSGGTPTALAQTTRSRCRRRLPAACAPARLCGSCRRTAASGKGRSADRSLQGLTIRHARGSTAIALDDILTIDGTDPCPTG